MFNVEAVLVQIMWMNQSKQSRFQQDDSKCFHVSAKTVLGDRAAAEQSRYTDTDTNTHRWWRAWHCVWQTVQTEALRVSIHLWWFLCQSLLDEALLSTLPPSDMAQLELLHTQAAAVSGFVDHGDTADLLNIDRSLITQISSPPEERRKEIKEEEKLP